MARTLIGWVLPGVFFTVGFGFSACVGSSNPDDAACDPTLTTSASSSSGAGGMGGGVIGTGGSGATDNGDPEISDDPDNNFHHPNEPVAPGAADPFEILKQRAAEGPPEVRTRLHSCSKLSYSALGEFLTSRGVNLDLAAGAGQPPSAGDLYKAASTRDALGLANFDARMGEANYYTISSATKMFDIFVQSATQIIANIQNMPECQINGIGNPMFDPVTGKCDFNALSCIMGRPATDDDTALCNLLISQAAPNELENRKRLTVAAFLAAAHTCQ